MQDHGFLTGQLGKLSQETLHNHYLSIHESQISNSISEYGTIKLRNLIHNVSYFQASNFLSLCSFESQTDEDSGTLCLFQKRTMELLFCQAAGHTQSVLRKNRSQKPRTLQNTSEGPELFCKIRGSFAAPLCRAAAPRHRALCTPHSSTSFGFEEKTQRLTLPLGFSKAPADIGASCGG